jgi:uncharacterized protein YbjT (DUF2867 family)
MKTILVTGGTGSVGRPTVEALRAAGHQFQILSRHPGTDHVRGDLTTGEGIAAAVEGITTVLHLATSRGHADVRQTQNLIEHAKAAGVSHLIFISIVGVDQIPLTYYRDKVTIERLVAESSIPFTILRATQFHDLVDEILTAQRFLPALLAPAIPLQSISAADVADRLVELTGGLPAGRVPDLGGPEQLTFPAMARAWKEAKRSRRPVLPIHLPGKTFRAFAAGAALPATVQPSPHTFDAYLSQHYGVRP